MVDSMILKLVDIEVYVALDIATTHYADFSRWEYINELMSIISHRYITSLNFVIVMPINQTLHNEMN